MSDFLLPFVEGRKSAGAFSSKAMIIASFGTAILVSMQTSLHILFCLALMIVVGGTVSRTRWKSVFSLAAKFEVFVLFWIVMEPFIFGSTVFATLSLPFGTFPLYLEGLMLGIMLSFRMSLIIVLFIATLSHMTLGEFVGAVRGLWMPASIIGSLLIMLRYVPQFINERRVMRESQLLRGLDSAARTGQIRSLGSLVGTTMDRAFDRSTVVYDSMVLRGFGKRFHPSGAGFHRSDVLLLVLVVLLGSAIYGILPIPVQVLCM